MKTISLTQGKVALVDDQDYEWLNLWKWRTGGNHNIYYANRNVLRLGDKRRTETLMHRLILNAPKGIQVDHINCDGLDNRRSNLRLCSHAENQRHQQIHQKNKTGYKGVKIEKRSNINPYTAQIRVDGRTVYLGCYPNIKAAARAYDAAALKYHREFAMTNEMLKLYQDGIASIDKEVVDGCG